MAKTPKQPTGSSNQSGGSPRDNNDPYYHDRLIEALQQLSKDLKDNPHNADLQGAILRLVREPRVGGPFLDKNKPPPFKSTWVEPHFVSGHHRRTPVSLPQEGAMRTEYMLRNAPGVAFEGDIGGTKPRRMPSAARVTNSGSCAGNLSGSQKLKNRQAGSECVPVCLRSPIPLPVTIANDGSGANANSGSGATNAGTGGQRQAQTWGNIFNNSVTHGLNNYLRGGTFRNSIRAGFRSFGAQSTRLFMSGGLPSIGGSGGAGMAIGAVGGATAGVVAGVAAVAAGLVAIYNFQDAMLGMSRETVEYNKRFAAYNARFSYLSTQFEASEIRRTIASGRAREYSATELTRTTIAFANTMQHQKDDISKFSMGLQSLGNQAGMIGSVITIPFTTAIGALGDRLTKLSESLLGVNFEKFLENWQHQWAAFWGQAAPPPAQAHGIAAYMENARLNMAGLPNPAFGGQRGALGEWGPQRIPDQRRAGRNFLADRDSPE